MPKAVNYASLTFPCLNRESDVCDGLRLRLVSSLRDAERERLIGGNAYATTNQITLAATLPNAVSKRVVNSEGRSQVRISCSIARVIATYNSRASSSGVLY